MAFGIKAHNALWARSYEDCAALFNEPANLRRMGWGPDKRPLDGVRKTHMRVERGADYYDAVLYSTSMARYYKPDIVNGKEVREVWYNVHGSQSSSTFQWNVLGINPAYFVQRAPGRSVIVGMNPDAAGLFPVRLRYVDGLLDVSKSRDAPAQLSSTTSAERKIERKEFRQWLRTYEAMSKVMTTGRMTPTWQLVSELKPLYITKELFDPTALCTYISLNGVKAVVDAVYPLGDVKNYNGSFKEVT